MKTIIQISVIVLAVLSVGIGPAEAKRNILGKMSGTTVIVDGHAPREGSGVGGNVLRKLPTFTRIELRSAEHLRVSRGTAQSLALSGDDNLLELISTEVKGDTLIIDARDSYRSRKPILVEITLPLLSELRLAGSADASLEALDPQAFKLVIDGSGTVDATGAVKQLEIRLNGSGNAEFYGVAADAVKVQVNGSGRIDLGAIRALNAQVNGSGDVVYRGTPAELKVDVNGSGSVHPR